ncbi:molybdopterin-guanine dinucleotide biosynthesis protein MobA [Corynebacterium phocae]|uniref:Molybdopterin-guanine dinucleotide biosynthesis protein MobA n=1 Tax=Corynebacterium phocae TaxID=161895 RepID=A0A1L7D582_9CORY|nr:DUF6457 domain-containing protein [Corynebacterium phocae]APT93227.1 molybdopterin-guanine dinucleotide biosynthesis protein MobA [Corynebacterium phocae]KAA8721544.1 molybdopterin-guanine dinucleotide biosynthesis protein MobA [Corynebacterium phocae]
MPKDPQAITTANAWLKEISTTLNLDPQEATELTGELLELTREVAHNRTRPGAPLTAFLVGLASRDLDDARANIAAIRKLI